MKVTRITSIQPWNLIPDEHRRWAGMEKTPLEDPDIFHEQRLEEDAIMHASAEIKDGDPVCYNHHGRICKQEKQLKLINII